MSPSSSCHLLTKKMHSSLHALVAPSAPSMRRALSQLTIRGTYRGNDCVQSFCDYLLASDIRPLYLRSLLIHDVWKKDNVAPSFSSLAAVLRRAHSMRELYVARQAKLVINACPAFADALASIDSLHAFHICDVDWDVVSPILSRMPCQLRVLRFEVESSGRRSRATKPRQLHHFVNSLTTLALYYVPNISEAIERHTVWPTFRRSRCSTAMSIPFEICLARSQTSVLSALGSSISDSSTPPECPRLDFVTIRADISLSCPVHHMQLALDCQDH